MYSRSLGFRVEGLHRSAEVQLEGLLRSAEVQVLKRGSAGREHAILGYTDANNLDIHTSLHISVRACTLSSHTAKEVHRKQ